MVETEKEGLIQKWTNYWTGWQPRWMVLSNGILSYYNNEDEVDKGCRASIKLSACDIIAYPADNTRLDVVVKNEQRWYLKTSSPAERQAWLIAMGSSKANTSDGATRKDPVVENLRSTMNEVKLFRDLLIQQTGKLKAEAQKSEPDEEKLTESSSMLSTTCDTFLATIGRCIDLAETAFVLQPPTSANLLGGLNQKERGDSATAVPKLNMQKSRHRKRGPSRTDSTSSIASCAATISTPASPLTIPEIPVGSRPLKFTSLESSSSTPQLSSICTNNQTHQPLVCTTDAPPIAATDTTGFGVPSPNTPPPPYHFTEAPDASGKHDHQTNDRSCLDETFLSATSNSNDQVINHHDNDDDEEGFKMLTFFSAMLHSFSDIVLEADGGIPTSSFLSACEGIIPFLDTIGSTAFAPVKIDFFGNIAKLQTKQKSNPDVFVTLQVILQDEITSRTTKARNSATDALLWLKRGLRFIQTFLNNFKNGQRDLTLALNSAYADTLKVYHSWVVKGIFALAVKAAPYSTDFVRALTNNSPENAEDPRFIDVLIDDIDQYTTAMDVVLNIIDHFYAKNNLESALVV